MKALIVDDDQVLADVVAFALRREGFRVSQAYDGEMALQLWREEKPDLILLDVNLPKLDGFAVCQCIREQADTPIMFLTVRNREEDILHGLELGADDYITKPFSPRQLVARAQAMLRRTDHTRKMGIRQVGELILDISRREVHIGNGDAVALTPLETRLLDYLMLNPGHVLTKDAIIDHVWGPEGGDRDVLHQLVYRLRVKITRVCNTDAGEPPAAEPFYIKTMPGLGYGLAVSATTG